MYENQLAAANRDHDFKFVAVGQQVLRELAARHDCTIMFQGNALAAKLHVLKQGGNINRCVEMARFAVDGD